MVGLVAVVTALATTTATASAQTMTVDFQCQCEKKANVKNAEARTGKTQNVCTATSTPTVTISSTKVKKKNRANAAMNACFKQWSRGSCPRTSCEAVVTQLGAGNMRGSESQGRASDANKAGMKNGQVDGFAAFAAERIGSLLFVPARAPPVRGHP